MMKLSKSQKKFVDNNKDKYEVKELAQKLHVDQKVVKSYLTEKNKHKQKTKNSAKPNQTVSVTPQGNSIVLKTIKDLKVFYLSNLDIVVAIVFVIIFAYVNSLWGEFVSDDLPSYVRNPIMTSFAESFKPGQWYAVTGYTFFKLFGINPVPFHIVSVMLHVINTLLLLPVISTLFKNKVALISVFIFALHPVNSETIAWVSAQVYLLIMLCFLVCANLLILYKNSSQQKYYIAALINFGLFYFAMLDVRLLIVPLLLVVFEVLLLDNSQKVIKPAVKIAPFLIIGAIFILIQTATVESRLSEDWALNQSVSLKQSAPYSMYSALKLLVFPKDLTLYHEGEILNPTLFKVMVFVSLLYLVLIGYVYFYLKNKKLTGLLLFIPISIAPVFSPRQVAWFVAERYLYFGSIAFSILVAKLFLYSEKKAELPKLATILTVILLLVYSIKVVIRNNEWSTPKKLWESTARVSPASPRAYNNLGDIYATEGNLDLSLKAFEHAIKLDEAYAKTNGGYYQVAHDALHNMGNVLIQFGKWEEAEPYLLESLKLKPNLFQSHYKLGLLEYKRENYQKAAEYFKTAYEIAPFFTEAGTAYEHVVNEKL